MDNIFFNYCIDQELFTREALDRAVNMTSESVSIYETLVQNGVISQERLAITAGEFYKVPVVDLSQVKPEPSALRYGSNVLGHKLGFLPFAIDPAAGVLIAIMDYANQESVRIYLQGQRVERMNFYIAPCNTLIRYINTYLEAPTQRERLLSIPEENARRRKSSVVHTQYLSFDSIPIAQSATVPDPETLKTIQNLQKKVKSLTEENMALRQQMDHISRMIELESQLTRELASALKANGTLSNITFDRLLSTLR